MERILSYALSIFDLLHHVYCYMLDKPWPYIKTFDPYDPDAFFNLHYTLYSKFESIMSTCLIMIIMRRIHKSWVIVNRIVEIETAFSIKACSSWSRNMIPYMTYPQFENGLYVCCKKYHVMYIQIFSINTYIDISNRGMMLIKRYVDIQIPIKFGTVVHLANTSLGNIHCSLSFLFGKF